MFKIELTRVSRKFLKNCEKEIYLRILNKIEGLSNNPFPNDSKRIVNKAEKLFRVMVGDFRILYSILNDRAIILIVDIDKRERIY